MNHICLAYIDKSNYQIQYKFNFDPKQDTFTSCKYIKS